VLAIGPWYRVSSGPRLGCGRIAPRRARRTSSAFAAGAGFASCTLREAARSLGAEVELRFLDVPYDELVRRVVERTANGGIPITASHMERYRAIFQPPTADELSLFDPPLEHAGS
jgi:hypothetical protein